MSFKNELLFLSSLYYSLFVTWCKKSRIFLHNIKFFFIVLFLVEILLKINVYLFTSTQIFKTPYQSIHKKLTFLNLQKLPFELKKDKVLHIYKNINTTVKLERRIEIRSGEIHSSLFEAMHNAKIPGRILPQIVDMFNSNINFTTDLRHGDRFYIIYETFWNLGKQVRVGRLLAGEFINDNNIYQAIWFHEPNNKMNGNYYSFNGTLLKKYFFKSPLPCGSISSGFTMRKHPIRGLWKKHNGIDLAAPSGTPIYASGDGIVNFMGKKNGYGNIIVIQHANNYTTFYGHMSRFSSRIHKGTKVYQNDVIGYVGNTGLATKPHLHYEFRVNNIPQDPLIMNNLQKSLTGKQLQRFQTVVADMTYRLTLFRRAQDNFSFIKSHY